MSNEQWIAVPDLLQDEEVLRQQVSESFNDTYQRSFAADPLVNHRLPIEISAIRDVEGWRLFLLLTPWMLARIYFHPDGDEVDIPVAWQAWNRLHEPYLVLGPSVSITLMGLEQKAHLNFHQELGHYLVQPLMLRMEQFGSADEVYRRWNAVIETRNENMKKRREECRCQEEISRREFFTHFTAAN